ncbi:MAG: ribose 5-phosphate isomerase B [Ignavibacteriales bacterium]|nr:ribose 5-phosphate isomerase B [Ignavibacteriales bacterium]
MAKTLVTEKDVLDAVKKGARFLSVAPGAIITPSAQDVALQHRIEILQGTRSPQAISASGVESVTVQPPKEKRSPNASTVVALGADHGGFQLKETLKAYLSELGYSVADVGTHSEQACDYPDFAYAVASLVTRGEADKGIMIDAVGAASAIVANKVPAIRAVNASNEFTARSSREHNDANVLTLGGRVLGVEAAKAIVKIWLETWFGGGRHQARVQKITDIEEKFSKK